MKQIVSLLSFCSSLLFLGACSQVDLRIPFRSEHSEKPESSLIDILEPDDKVSDLESNPKVIASSKSLPRQVVLESSEIPALSEADLQQCQQRLGLAEEKNALADPTNYGDRHTVDQWGRRLVSTPQIIVLHETVLNEEATINLFQTPHPNDNDQVSYHMLIGEDGSRLRIVPDLNRAYGAGMSAFGDVTQRTKPGSVGSINNIALHLSLVTPPDGRGNTSSHSGYTDAQYQTLAAQVLLWQAKFGIPFTRLTTHAAVDRSRSRYDPRSFRWDSFQPHYNQAASTCGFTYLDNQEAGL